jgi:UrcA family protein
MAGSASTFDSTHPLEEIDMNRTALTVTGVVAALAMFGTATASAVPPGARSAERTVIVRIDDLDTQTEAGAAALYERITTAARRVCHDSGTRELAMFRVVKACRAEAVAKAIADSGVAGLAAASKTRKSVG